MLTTEERASIRRAHAIREDRVLCEAIEILRARGRDDLANELCRLRFEEPAVR